MAVESTFVTSLNGMTGGTYPRNLNTDVVIDASQIKRQGSSGNNIPKDIQNIAQTMKILELEPIENSDTDFVMKVDTNVPYQPNA